MSRRIITGEAVLLIGGVLVLVLGSDSADMVAVGSACIASALIMQKTKP